jgi:hypothetical protein
MIVNRIGDWSLEDRLARRGKSLVVLFLNSDDPKVGALRKEFTRVAREHRDAEFYEADLVENPSLTAKYSLPQAPMVLVFVDGTEVGRHAGTSIAATVDRVLGVPPHDREENG